MRIDRRRLAGWTALTLAAPVLLGLAGCTEAPAGAAAPTVTVTVAPRAAPAKPGDTASVDLAAACAVEGTILSAQSTRMTAGSKVAKVTIDRTVRWIYLSLQLDRPPSPVAEAVADILQTDTARVNPANRDVQRAQQRIAAACTANGTPAGVASAGG